VISWLDRVGWEHHGQSWQVICHWLGTSKPPETLPATLVVQTFSHSVWLNAQNDRLQLPANMAFVELPACSAQKLARAISLGLGFRRDHQARHLCVGSRALADEAVLQCISGLLLATGCSF